MMRGQHQPQEADHHHQGRTDQGAGGVADGQVGGAHTLAQDVARNTRVKPGVSRPHLKQVLYRVFNSPLCLASWVLRMNNSSSFDM